MAIDVWNKKYFYDILSIYLGYKDIDSLNRMAINNGYIKIDTTPEGVCSITEWTYLSKLQPNKTDLDNISNGKFISYKKRLKEEEVDRYVGNIQGKLHRVISLKIEMCRVLEEEPPALYKTFYETQSQALAKIVEGIKTAIYNATDVTQIEAINIKTLVDSQYDFEDIVNSINS